MRVLHTRRFRDRPKRRNVARSRFRSNFRASDSGKRASLITRRAIRNRHEAAPLRRQLQRPDIHARGRCAAGPSCKILNAQVSSFLEPLSAIQRILLRDSRPRQERREDTTCGPTKGRSKKRRKRREEAKERDKENRRKWTQRYRTKRAGGGGVPKWRSKPRDKISLCARTRAHTGLRQRIPSSRSHISRIPLSYFTARPPSPTLFLPVSPRRAKTLEWKARASLIFLLSRFSDPRFYPLVFLSLSLGEATQRRLPLLSRC